MPPKRSCFFDSSATWVTGTLSRVRRCIQGTPREAAAIEAVAVPGFYMCRKSCDAMTAQNRYVCAHCADIGLVYEQDVGASSVTRVQFNIHGFVSLGPGSRRGVKVGPSGPGVAVLARTEEGKRFLEESRQAIMGTGSSLVELPPHRLPSCPPPL